MAPCWRKACTKLRLRSRSAKCGTDLRVGPCGRARTHSPVRDHCGFLRVSTNKWIVRRKPTFPMAVVDFARVSFFSRKKAERRVCILVRIVRRQDLRGAGEMPLTPETRLSLIRRLQSGTDADAWTEFSNIYRPVIVRLASSKGLQAADAEDLAQNVLLSVSRHIVRWKPDPKRGRFRAWLQKIVRNATLNALSRIPQDAAQGGTTAMRSLANLPQCDAVAFDVEWKREALNWAADQIRPEFEPATWDAFWLTAVDGQSPEAAAAHTGKSIGAIYIARTRIMKRIRAKIHELLDAGETL